MTTRTARFCFSVVQMTWLFLVPRVGFSDPIHSWSERFGGTGGEAIRDIATDAAGNLFVIGTYSGSPDLGGGPLPDPLGSNMFVAKYDAIGAHQWSKGFAGDPSSVALDASGNVFVTGSFKGTTSFGGETFTTIDDYLDVFVVKLDAAGNHQWSHAFGNSAGLDDVGRGIALDSSGFSVVVGAFTGIIDFGGGPLYGNEFDVFMVRFDPEGLHVWSKRFGGPFWDFGSAVAIDSQDDIVIAGTFLQSIGFGGGPITGGDGSEMFLAKFDPTGNHQWSFGSITVGGNSYVEPNDLVIDRLDSPVVVGSFDGTVSVGGSQLSTIGNSDVFLARYAPDGTHMWSKAFGYMETERGLKIASNHSGIFIAGTFVIQLNLGGGPLVSAGNVDTFLAKFNLAGYHMWSERVGNSFEDISPAVAADPLDHFIFAEGFRGTLDVGGGPRVSAGGYDVLLSSFLDESPLPVLVTSFDAVNRAGRIDLTWQLAFDETALSFELLRWEQANDPVIVATGEPSTRSYSDFEVKVGREYSYQLAVHDLDGNTYRSPVVTVAVPATAARLDQNSPNPFNPSTVITYTLGKPADVTLEIFDASGSLVVRLQEGLREAGSHRAVWDGRDSSGLVAASGVYFYRLARFPELGTRKMVLLK